VPSIGKALAPIPNAPRPRPTAFEPNPVAPAFNAPAPEANNGNALAPTVLKAVPEVRKPVEAKEAALAAYWRGTPLAKRAKDAGSAAQYTCLTFIAILWGMTLYGWLAA